MTLYHPAAYDTSAPVPSYWEASADPAPDGCAPLEGEARTEVAVIGGGYTGVSLALHLARDHGIAATVLEAGAPGWGASGRNGGFCCTGAAKIAIPAMVARVGRDEARRFYQSQIDAVTLVRDLARDEGIAIDPQGDGTIEVAHLPSRVAALAEEARLNNEVLGLPCTVWSREELAERAFAGPEAFGAIHYRHGFGLHPLKLHRGLTRAALARGARIHGHSRVIGWERAPDGHRLITAGGAVTARRVVVATNGYTDDALYPGLAGTVLPAFSNVLTTRPLTEAELAAQGWRTGTPVSDSRNLLFYFRLLADGRFLLGARGDTYGSPAAAARMRRWLTGRLAAMFPAWRDVEITHFWNGLVALSADRAPMIGPSADDPTVFHALAYHGNGVATSVWSGRALASIIAGADPAAVLPSLVSRPARRFPVPGLRPWYLRAAYGWFRLRDAV